MGFHNSREQYENQTYTEDDLLEKSSFVDLDYVTVKVTPTICIRKCFTIPNLAPMNLKESLILILKRTMGILIFIHNGADEYWLTWSPSYTSKNKFRLNIKSDTEAFATELKVAETQIEFYP